MFDSISIGLFPLLMVIISSIFDSIAIIFQPYSGPFIVLICISPIVCVVSTYLSLKGVKLDYDVHDY